MNDLNGVSIKEIERRMRPLRPRTTANLMDSAGLEDGEGGRSRALLHSEVELESVSDQLAAAVRELQRAEKLYVFDQPELVRSVDPDEINFCLTLRSMRTPFGYLAPRESLEDLIKRDRLACQALHTSPAHFAEQLAGLLDEFERSQGEVRRRPMVTGEVPLGGDSSRRRKILVRRLTMRSSSRSPFVNIEGEGVDEQWDEQYVLFAPDLSPRLPELHVLGNQSCGSIRWIRDYGFFGGNGVDASFVAAGSQSGLPRVAADALQIAANSGSTKFPSEKEEEVRNLNPFRLAPCILDCFFKGRWSTDALLLQAREIEYQIRAVRREFRGARASFQEAQTDLSLLRNEKESLQVQLNDQNGEGATLEDAILAVDLEIDQAKGQLLYLKSQVAEFERKIDQLKITKANLEQCARGGK